MRIRPDRTRVDTRAGVWGCLVRRRVVDVLQTQLAGVSGAAYGIPGECPSLIGDQHARKTQGLLLLERTAESRRPPHRRAFGARRVLSCRALDVLYGASAAVISAAPAALLIAALSRPPCWPRSGRSRPAFNVGGSVPINFINRFSRVNVTTHAELDNAPRSC